MRNFFGGLINRQSDAPLPSIFLNAIPKSAGQYINTTLLNGLPHEHIDVSIGVFPGDLIIFSELQEFSRGGYIAHHHLEPTFNNSWYLRRFNIRTVIHIRDPRACILSWVHHIMGATRTEDLLPHPMIAPPQRYFTDDFSAKIDWQIDNALPFFVQFIEGWLDARDTLGDLLKFTTYDDFVSDSDRFYKNLLEWFEIPNTAFKNIPLPKVKENNFRSGKLAEWREVFNDDQKSRAFAKMSPRLFQQFDWQP